MGRLRIKTQMGQVLEVSWETVVEEEKAAKLFEEYAKKGYVAITENPQTGEYMFIRSFDPKLRKIDMWPLVYGG